MVVRQPMRLPGLRAGGESPAPPVAGGPVCVRMPDAYCQGALAWGGNVARGWAREGEWIGPLGGPGRGGGRPAGCDPSVTEGEEGPLGRPWGGGAEAGPGARYRPVYA